MWYPSLFVSTDPTWTIQLGNAASFLELSAALNVVVYTYIGPWIDRRREQVENVIRKISNVHIFAEALMSSDVPQFDEQYTDTVQRTLDEVYDFVESIEEEYFEWARGLFRKARSFLPYSLLMSIAGLVTYALAGDLSIPMGAGLVCFLICALPFVLSTLLVFSYRVMLAGLTNNVWYMQFEKMRDVLPADWRPADRPLGPLNRFLAPVLIRHIEKRRGRKNAL